MNAIIQRWPLFLLCLAMIGCGRTDATPKPGAKQAPGGTDFMLATEPAGAKGVIAVKQQAKDGDDVVIVGRIGGSDKPFTGRAAFTIVDPSLKACNDRDADACPVPWDYCCESPDDLVKATVLVKFVDEKGKTIARDAKESMGLKELQTVVIRGIARRNGNDGISVEAKGIFIKK